MIVVLLHRLSVQVRKARLQFGRRWRSTEDQLVRFLDPRFVGLLVEEIRTDYARMRLPYRRELNQPHGVMHGGAIATLIDTAVVPAIGSAYEDARTLLTVDMHVTYLAAVAGEDAIAEAWVEKRGRSLVFCRVEVRSASGVLASTASLVYKVSSQEMRS